MYYLAAGIFVLIGVKSQTAIIRTIPQNTAGSEGSSVRLECEWKDIGNGKTRWKHYIGPNKRETLISEDSKVFDPTKYAIHGTTRDMFDLEIKSLKDTDVGEYSCETALANIVYGVHVVKLGLYAYDKFPWLLAAL